MFTIKYFLSNQTFQNICYYLPYLLKIKDYNLYCSNMNYIYTTYMYVNNIYIYNINNIIIINTLLTEVKYCRTSEPTYTQDNFSHTHK